MATKIKLILKALKLYYSAPLAVTFYKFRNGLIYFSVGLMTIYMANIYMEPSHKQELIMLLGLVMSAIGFFIAMMAQIRMVISRVVVFFTKKR